MAPKRSAPPAAAAPSSAAASTKRPRAGDDPLDAKIASVVEALGDEKLMPSSVTKVSLQMLATGAPLALRAAAEERHDFQARVAGHIQEVFQEGAAALGARGAEAEAAVAGAAGAIEAGEAKLRAATEEAEAAQKVVDERRQALGERSAELKAAEKEVQATAAKRKELAREKATHEKEKDKYKAVEENLLNVLVAGSWSSDKEAKKLSDKLVKDMERYGTEPSLLASVPSVLLKKPEERKGFDDMVITSIRGIVESRVQAVEAVLEANADEDKKLEAEAERSAATSTEAAAARAEAAEAVTQAEADRMARAEAVRGEQQALEQLRIDHARRVDEAGAARGDSARLEVVAEMLEALMTRSAVAPPAAASADEQDGKAAEPEAGAAEGGGPVGAALGKRIDAVPAVDVAAVALEVGGA